MKTTKNTPKTAWKSTARRKTATLPEIYAEGYETRVVYPNANVPTPRPVIVGHARHGLAIDHEPTAAQPPALPSFR